MVSVKQSAGESVAAPCLVAVDPAPSVVRAAPSATAPGWRRLSNRYGQVDKLDMLNRIALAADSLQSMSTAIICGEGDAELLAISAQSPAERLGWMADLTTCHLGGEPLKGCPEEWLIGVDAVVDARAEVSQ